MADLCATNGRLMRIYYVTLNTGDEARRISLDLLDSRLAVCTNWFPITCMYRWEGRTTEEPEVALLIKTRAGLRDEIEAVIRRHVDYTNCVAEFATESLNEPFGQWLSECVPARERK